MIELIPSPLLSGYLFARAGLFKVESQLLPWAQYWATGNKPQLTPEQKALMQNVLPEIKKLFDQDVENIKNGYYPISVLKPENLRSHLTRVPQLFKDAVQASRRKDQKNAKFFDPIAKKYLKNLPAYYLRNFHYQTSGYLGEKSADLYEHQVEVLFAGTADPMRRQVIPSMKKHFKNSTGQGLRFLEIGSGTGRLTRFMKQAFPKAHITCLDLSPVYLKKSKKKLAEFENIDFVSGAAEKTDWNDGSFDAVYSCFLFHELPRSVRQAVCNEAYRLLKSKGFFGLVDSLQLNDHPDMDWALKQFPKDFHEPFYRNYISHPMEGLLRQAHFKKVTSEVHFLSKVVTGKKS